MSGAGPDELLSSPDCGEQPGDEIDRYRLLEKLGEGAVGIVWRAIESEPLRREVALKIIKLGMDTEEVVARFRTERQFLALMDHPGIARVHDAGATSTGRPYFVMELVENGQPITAYCDRHRLDTAQRLNLFIEVCRAVQHAHQKGVIHRDLKPSNILVIARDGKATPKVIDFGIAKVMGEDLVGPGVKTRWEEVVGTLGCMSPEQAGGEEDIDTRSDVYSLGVVLYELLVGRPPFDSARLRRAALDSALRTIQEERPAVPSSRLSRGGNASTSAAAARRLSPTRLRRLVRGDLDQIVMKALEMDRDRRYGSAIAVAEDVGRFLNDEVVEAIPPSLGYRLGKLVVKHRGAGFGRRGGCIDTSSGDLGE